MLSRYKRISTFYNNLYTKREDVWNELAGRGPHFTTYLAALIQELKPRCYIDIGSGEGALLGTVSAPSKVGVEISRSVIKIARARSTASFCQAIAEQLPYPTGHFNVVSTVGVMEHFVDDIAATREICRVLRDGGHYVAALYIATPFPERVRLKIAEYVYPRFRPAAMIRWLVEKLKRWLRERSAKVGPPGG